jgi:hypothetical protein
MALRSWQTGKTMLTALFTGIRFKLAIVLAACAVLSFVLPPAVMAFGHGENTAHCLSKANEVNHGIAKNAMNNTHGGMHHADHATPDGDDSTPAPDRHMTCCGLFCVSAVTTDGGTLIEHSLPEAHDPVGERDPLTSILDRLDRPPISLLFV